ncbi:riboflavin synthase [Candidatus Phycosocius spiralis]|uniref:Riboflavin synthase n=1 Tax=Candidatus Phycosocius spiralis TaxID=2815099 RepID=A0ABQ4PSA6_9PROT|nr:riboflavin synthase [Candidatus Phycosocius spiralis]GIU65894.1 riboflavin synthase subunit alpha [Candidatus Phycosocius spiralis]
MFTGIITDIGTVIGYDHRLGTDAIFTIASQYEVNTLTLGASIAHQGVCLTLIELNPGPTGSVWRVQVSQETLDVTCAHDWRLATKLNLERALKVGDELGGHMVSGHVDGIGEVVQVRQENDSHRVLIRIDEAIAKFIAPKGSIAIDGVSLTINEVDDAIFGVNIIPHTWAVTTLGRLKAGTRVNVEADQVARYVERILSRKN